MQVPRWPRTSFGLENTYAPQALKAHGGTSGKDLNAAIVRN